MPRKPGLGRAMRGCAVHRRTDYAMNWSARDEIGERHQRLMALHIRLGHSPFTSFFSFLDGT